MICHFPCIPFYGCPGLSYGEILHIFLIAATVTIMKAERNAQHGAQVATSAELGNCPASATPDSLTPLSCMRLAISENGPSSEPEGHWPLNYPSWPSQLSHAANKRILSEPVRVPTASLHEAKLRRISESFNIHTRYERSRENSGA